MGFIAAYTHCRIHKTSKQVSDKLSSHQHNIRPQFNIFLILLRVIDIINHTCNSHVRLFLTNLGVIPYHPFGFVRVAQAVVYYPVRDAYFRSILGERLPSRVIDNLLSNSQLLGQRSK